MFTNPPSSLPSAEPDLSAEFSQDVFSDITSHLEEFGTIKSGRCDYIHGPMYSGTHFLTALCTRICYHGTQHTF